MLRGRFNPVGGILDVSPVALLEGEALLPQIRAVRDRWIDVQFPPVSWLIGVASLFKTEGLVEIDTIAIASAADVAVR